MNRLFALFSLLLAIVFSLPGSPLGLGIHLDALNFQLWTRLLPPPPQEADPHLAWVELPPQISQATQPSWQTTIALTELLRTIGKHQPAAIGITSDLEALLLDERQLLDLLPQGEHKPSVAEPYRALHRELRQAAVVWRSPPPGFGDSAPAVQREARSPPIYNLHEQLIRHAASNPGRHSPQSLLHYQNGAIIADFELSILAQANAQTPLNWHIPGELGIGRADRKISLYGTLRPWPQHLALSQLQSRAIDGQALALEPNNPAHRARLQNKITVLGKAGDPQGQRAIARLNALMTSSYSYSPWWQWLPLTLMSLAIWYAGNQALRRLPLGSLALGATLICALILAFTLLVQHQWNLWLASGDNAIYTVSLALLLMLQRLRRNHRLHLQLEADDARLQLAALHLQQRNPAAAYTQLQRTVMCHDTADLLLESGQQFEQAGDLPEAIAAYRSILQCFPTHQRAATALAVLAPASHAGTTDWAATRLVSVSSDALPCLSRYEVVRLLGRGAMGEVFLANDPKIKRQIAIKTLRLDTIGKNGAEARRRFFREAETAGQLNHPNIVSIYDVGEEGGLAYIAMDYVPGGTLADWTDTGKLLDLATLYSVMEQVAQALAYAHRRGIVHRDIKPGNLLFNPADLTIKISDFGIASLTDYSRTRTGTILGSPYYMSPEQLASSSVTAASDLYSLGVTFYQLACGGLPFEADSLPQLAAQISQHPHRPIGQQRKGLPRSCTRIINRALAKEPPDRFIDAQEMSVLFAKGARTLNQARKKAG